MIGIFVFTWGLHVHVHVYVIEFVRESVVQSRVYYRFPKSEKRAYNPAREQNSNEN